MLDFNLKAYNNWCWNAANLFMSYEKSSVF